MIVFKIQDSWIIYQIFNGLIGVFDSFNITFFLFFWLDPKEPKGQDRAKTRVFEPESAAASSYRTRPDAGPLLRPPTRLKEAGFAF